MILRPLPLLLTLAVLAAAAPAPAQARGPGDELRTAGSCGRGASAALRLRENSGRIDLRFDVTASRPRAVWRVVVIQEGRVAWRGRVRARSSGSLSVRRRLQDLGGADRITVRTVGPRGITCVASGTLAG